MWTRIGTTGLARLAVSAGTMRGMVLAVIALAPGLAWAQALPRPADPVPLTNGETTAVRLRLKEIFVTGGTPGVDVSVAFGNGNYSGGAVQITNDLPASVKAYPTAFAGYGIMNQPGGNVFGLFGRADLMTNGVATNEMNSFDLSGHEPSGALPPAVDFGTTDYVPIALQVVPFGANNSAVGISMAGPTAAGFLTAYYQWPSAAKQNGMFLDATATVGPAVTARFRSTQTGAAVIGQVMGSPAPTLPVIQVQDASGTTVAAMRANGDLAGNRVVQSVATGLAAAGTSQGTALALTSMWNVVSTTAAGSGVLLPATIGAETAVYNRGANALLVYPPSGASIDGGAANVAVSVPAGGKVRIVAVSATACFSQ